MVRTAIVTIELGLIVAGIQSFKKLLDGMADVESDHAPQREILKQYLEVQSATADDESAVFMDGVMQTWSFAAQSNNEHLLSACPAVLALLLRTIGRHLDWLDFGRKLVRTLLQKREQSLISRGVTSNKFKENLISPSLRLLKEICIFDGGSFSKALYRTRNLTLKSLARNMNLHFKGEGNETTRKPSVRSNAVRLALSLLKFLPAEAKRELLGQRDVIQALTKDIHEDPPYVVREILETIKAHVLSDKELPRDAKTRLFNTSCLARIAMLYRYDQDTNDETKQKPIDELAHELLLAACTSASQGPLNADSGYYPRGIDPNETSTMSNQHGSIDLGLDSIDWLGKFDKDIPVRNTILSEFIQTLKPWSSQKQSELLIAILKAAPELVAQYFYGKRDFSFDPKLTEVWMGYSALVFAALQLPVPEYFGNRKGYAALPPPRAIVLENLLPVPLCQKTLTRCLTSSESLVRFYAIRLLCEVMAKLKRILAMYHEAAQTSRIWAVAAEDIVDNFCLRCPSIQDVIKCFRAMADTDLMQRQAITGLLNAYYEVIPKAALHAKFDVSSLIAHTTLALRDSTLVGTDLAMRKSELQNLYRFAWYSPGMRWFHKLAEIQMTPFLALLKLSTEKSSGVEADQMRSILQSVTLESQVMQNQTSESALETLANVLEAGSTSKYYNDTCAFVDDCVSRCSAKPVKYFTDLERCSVDLVTSDGSAPVSLLVMTMADQWSFLVQNKPAEVVRDIAIFVGLFFNALVAIGEDRHVMGNVLKETAQQTPKSSKERKELDEALKGLTSHVPVPNGISSATTKFEPTKDTQKSKNVLASDPLSQIERQAPPQDHKALVKWQNKDISTLIDDEILGSLFTLLSSQHLQMRKEALTTLSKISASIKSASFEEKEQVWLLVNELIETARPVIDEKPLCAFHSTFAKVALGVLVQPLHVLYEKVNRFLVQGPIWDTTRIPLFHKILDEPPTHDDARYTEISWLLDILKEGMVSVAELEVCRQRHVFEKLLVLWTNTFVGNGIRIKILKVLLAASSLDGGASMLVTRCSIYGFLTSEIEKGRQGLTETLEALRASILENCDQQRISEWSNGGLSEKTGSSALQQVLAH